MSRREKRGANSRIRTDDLLITNELLYQLSYVGLTGTQSRSGILHVKGPFRTKAPTGTAR